MRIGNFAITHQSGSPVVSLASSHYCAHHKQKARDLRIIKEAKEPDKWECGYNDRVGGRSEKGPGWALTLVKAQESSQDDRESQKRQCGSQTQHWQRAFEHEYPLQY